jgi:Tfp pilus assembly protein PilO
MKMDFDNLSTWTAGSVGAIILAAAAKFVWPLLNSNLSSALQTAKDSAELNRQIKEERDRAVTRADAADKRLEDMQAEFYRLKSSVDMLTFQLKLANDKIEALTAEVRRLEGGPHA